MKFLKKIFKAILSTTLIASFAFTAACSNVDGGGGGSNKPPQGDTEPDDDNKDPNATQLTAPHITLSQADATISWSAVTNASAYSIYCNETLETSVTSSPYTIPHSTTGSYVYKIKATSTDKNFSTSEFSNTQTYIVSGTVTPGPVDPELEKYTVTFDSNGGSTAVDPQEVYEGYTATKPAAPVWAGKQFVKWCTDEAGNNEYNFAMPVTGPLTLYAAWATLPAELKEVKAYSESLAVSWAETVPAEAKVEYQLVGDSAWTAIDNELIRLTSSNVARADIVGITAGSYNVKITTSGKSEINIPSPVTVEEYDRSGYAHFKYTEGVGAYKDDGTLKDNALVIYVTDENKDTVMEQVCADNADVKMFQIPTYSGTPGKDWKGKNASGIGWWLNNAQYGMDNKASDKNKRPSNTYDPVNGKNLAFKSVDRPIAIRFIGTVTAPEGLTEYSSEDQGGTIGDNGFMARMKNYKNITLEGIGEDAVIEGWGFHFMAGSDAVNGQGKSFETRNLTFSLYPEDAVGMEGVQSGSTLTGPVERCWVHNNTFLPGYCANPAESDKGEGDGSCDFKRGEYFTCSYNYFTDCHKTNLIGSSDSSLQFNLTFHHNWWLNNGSRMPLARQANVHFYNNYVALDLNIHSNIDISHVHSIRANSYLFSEGNYYFGCKNIADKGAGKSYNNIMLATSGTNNMVDVANRDDKFSNSCKHYNGTDLSSFDTDPTLFYYNAQAKVSDCLLDDPVTARYKAITGAGCNGWGENNPKKQSNVTAAVRVSMADKTPTSALQVPDEGALNVNFSSPPAGMILQGSVSKGAYKSAKNVGQSIIFTVSSSTLVKVAADSKNGLPSLVADNGRVMAQIPTGGVTVEIPAGTYFICAGVYGHEIKDFSVTSLSFEATANSAQERVDAAVAAINALPAAADISLSDKELVNSANLAYGALSAKDKADFDTTLVTKLNDCTAVYNTLCKNEVVAKINAIGTVNKNSYDLIKAAQDAYDALDSSLKGEISNYSTLTAAWAAYENFAVENVNELIDNLVNTDTLSVTDQAAIATAKTAYEAAKSAYDQLDEPQLAQITTERKNKLTNGLAAIAQLEKLFTFKAELADFEGTTVDASNISDANTINKLYKELSTAQKEALAPTEITKLNAILESLSSYAASAVSCRFTNGTPTDSHFIASGNSKTNNASLYINTLGETIDSGMKMQSSTQLTVKSDTKVTLTLYVDAAVDVKFNGTAKKAAQDGNGDIVVTYVIEAGGSVLVTKGGVCNLFYATLTPYAE